MAITACLAGEKEILEAILRHHQPSRDVVDVVHGASLLHWAAHRGDVAIVRMLLESQVCEVGVLDREGMVPLHYAAAAGREAAVALLIERGAEVDARAARSGATPLILAAGGGHHHCIACLLKHEANVNAADAGE